MTCVFYRAALESLFCLCFQVLTSPLFQTSMLLCSVFQTLFISFGLAASLFYTLLAIPHLLTSPLLLWMSFLI